MPIEFHLHSSEVHIHEHNYESPKTDEILAISKSNKEGIALLIQKVDKLGIDQAKLKSLTDSLGSQTDDLSKAVSENTPVS